MFINKFTIFLNEINYITHFHYTNNDQLQKLLNHQNLSYNFSRRIGNILYQLLIQFSKKKLKDDFSFTFQHSFIYKKNYLRSHNLYSFRFYFKCFVNNSFNEKFFK